MNEGRLRMRYGGASRILAVACLVLLAGVAGATQVKIKAGLATPVLQADKRQTAFVKVGLTGYPIASDERRLPVNVAIVLDKSGSMTGEKIGRARQAARQAIERLLPDDIVSVITYDTTVNVLVPATKLSDKSMVESAIDRIQAGGNTALFAGVAKGADELRKFFKKEQVNRIILLSDGLANVGPSNPSDLGQLGVSFAREGITVSTIGLGLGYNEDLMTLLASKSGGSHYFAEEATDLARTFEQEFRRTLSVVAQEVVVRIECSQGVRPVRVLNREAEIGGQTVTVRLDQLYSESEKYLVLEVELPASTDGSEIKVASIEATYGDLKTKTSDRVASTVSARFTKSTSEVEKSTDRTAMIDVVEQLGTEKGLAAMKLRDEGRVEEAKKLYDANSAFLASNAEKFSSDKLAKQTIENKEGASNLDEANWARQRKMQSSGDAWRIKQ